MRKASMLLLILLAFGAWAVAQTNQPIQITNGPVVEQLTPNSAIVAWTTNVPASAIAHYGTTSDPRGWTQTAEQAWGGQQSKSGTTHRVHLKDLQPNTTYVLEAESGQARGTGTSTKSQPIQFHTPNAGEGSMAYPYGQGEAPVSSGASPMGQTSPAQTSTQAVQITHGPVIEQLTPNSAIVAWTTNVPSSAILHYGTTSDPRGWTQTAEQAWGGQQSKSGTTHRIHLNNLQPKTTYVLQAESGQAQGSGTSTKSQPVEIHTPVAGSPAIAYPYGRGYRYPDDSDNAATSAAFFLCRRGVGPGRGAA